MTCYSPSYFGSVLPFATATRPPRARPALSGAETASLCPLTGRHRSRSRRVLMQDRTMQSPRDFSMYGAVDLGARQAAAQRRQQAARAAAAADAGHGPPASGPVSDFVFEVTEETFNNDVALRSRA